LASPARYDWTVWTRSDDSTTFTFLDGTDRVDLTGDTITLALEWAGGTSSITLVSGVDSEVVIEDQTVPATMGQVTIKMSFAQRIQLPLYSGVRYQLERTTGSDTLIHLYGEVTATNWIDHPDA